MSCYLNDLASKSIGLSGAISLRTRSRFEPIRVVPDGSDIVAEENRPSYPASDDSMDDRMSGKGRTILQEHGLQKRVEFPSPPKSASKEPPNGLLSTETTPNSKRISEESKKLEDEVLSWQIGDEVKEKDAGLSESISKELSCAHPKSKDDQGSDESNTKPYEDLPEDGETSWHENTGSPSAEAISSSNKPKSKASFSPSSIQVLNPSQFQPEKIASLRSDPLSSVQIKARNDSIEPAFADPFGSEMETGRVAISGSETPKKHFNTAVQSDEPKTALISAKSQSESMVFSPALETDRMQIRRPVKDLPSARDSSINRGSINQQPGHQRFIEPPKTIRKPERGRLKESNEEDSVEISRGQPVIRVTIGRIEVKAVSRPDTKAKAPAPKAQSTSLEEYLLSIRGGSK
jgi:hypothetical protein